MNKSHYLPVVLAGLLAAAGAQAQTAAPATGTHLHPAGGAAVTSNVPPKAGEASTFVQGRPNLNPNDPAHNPQMRSHSGMHHGSQSMGAAMTSDVPPRAGEASTFVQGRPNLNPGIPAHNPDVVSPRSREEVVSELMNRRAAFEAQRRSLLNADSHLGVAPITPAS
jgi:hypothetical protein